LNKKANLFIVTAPSGCGKTTLVQAIIEKLSNIKRSISHTTRPKRPHENDGEAYYFVSPLEFEKKIKANDFLEHAKVYNHDYGTSRSWVLEQLHRGTDVILEIDWQGARQIKQRLPESLSIFIFPPSLSALKDRLHKRQQDTKSAILDRLAKANSEMSHYREFDYLVVNDQLAKTVLALEYIIQGARYQRDIQIYKNHHLLEDLLKKR
jgi:guanylate kinase